MFGLPPSLWPWKPGRGRRVLIFTSIFAVGAFIILRYFTGRRKTCKQIVGTKPGELKSEDLMVIEKRQLFDVSGYRIEVVEADETCEAYLQDRSPCRPLVVGLDCEWCSGNQRPGSPNVPVALLQLAFPDGECLLVRLCKVRKVTPALEKLLTDKSILKFGVGIGNDSKRLSQGFGVQVAGCVDLQRIAIRSGVRGTTSLQGLADQLLGAELNKSPRLRCSNWEAESLSQDQVSYAAADAIVALHILQALVHMKISRQDHRGTAAINPNQTHTAETIATQTSLNNPQDFHKRSSHDRGVTWLSGEGMYSCLLSLCQGIVDVAYKQPRRSSAPVGQLRQPGQSEERRFSAYSVRKTPLYHNCQLLAPDGSLLSTVDKKKLDWYLQRGLGTLVSESPPTMKLHFEPAGRPNEDRQYYLLEKQNVCVVCGNRENCVRKNIVPHEYRRLFPLRLKEHMSHDVLLMCVGCHQAATQHDAALKQQLAADVGAPLNVSAQKYSEDPRLMKVRNHARALSKHTGSIPASRREELLLTLAQHFGCAVGEVTDDLIRQASEINPKSSNGEYISHAEMVVAGIQTEGSVLEFVRRWRQHFLDSMKPQFLPRLWCVEHNPKS